MSEVFAVHDPDLAVMDVVFIHGLDGDARKTWSRDDQRSFWPQWLVEDVDGVGVWSVGYEAWSSGWRGRSMSMSDRAINVMALLQNHGIGDRSLCFVAHSMGGLLAKEILLHAAEGRTGFAAFATAVRGVVFLATPHTGSGLTKAVDALGVLYRGTPAVDDLRRNGAYLRQLNDRYRDWVAEARTRHLVFFETHPTKGVRVVDESSANPGLARVRPIPVDADHISICKLSSRTEVVYGQVKRFVSELVTPPSEPQPEGTRAAPRHVQGHARVAVEIPNATGRRRTLQDGQPGRGAERRGGVGRPISELGDDDAVAFGVHPSVQVGDRPAVRDRSLPGYLARPHDEALHAEIALAERRSRVVILVGWSSAGKTRACWEAIRDVMPGWFVWHPLTPTRPAAVLEALRGNGVRPRTVIWLDELQLYLAAAPDGEQVATTLHELVQDPSRDPLLVLGSMWSRYIDEFSQQPTTDHAAALWVPNWSSMAVTCGISGQGRRA